MLAERRQHSSPLQRISMHGTGLSVLFSGMVEVHVIVATSSLTRRQFKRW
jgi:hypothetical protein